jgi:hypothetical protein
LVIVFKYYSPAISRCAVFGSLGGLSKISATNIHGFLGIRGFLDHPCPPKSPHLRNPSPPSISNAPHPNIPSLPIGLLGACGILSPHPLASE